MVKTYLLIVVTAPDIMVGRHLCCTVILVIVIQPLTQDILNCPVAKVPDLMGSFAGIDQPPVSHTGRQQEDPLATLIRLFRMRLTVKYFTDIGFYYWVQGPCFFQEELRVPL